MKTASETTKVKTNVPNAKVKKPIHHLAFIVHESKGFIQIPVNKAVPQNAPRHYA